MLSVNFNLVRRSPLKTVNKNILLYIFLIFYLDMYDLALFAGYAIYLSRIIIPVYNLYQCLPIFAAVFLTTQVAKITGFLLYNFSSDSYQKFAKYPLICVGISYFGLIIFPTYGMVGIGSFIIFVALRLMQGFAFGNEIGFVVKFANSSITVEKSKIATYYFILLSSEVGILVSIFFNRLLVSHGVALITYEFLWRFQFFINFLFICICIFIKSKHKIIYNRNRFSRSCFVYTIKKNWRYILLRSTTIFYSALLIVVVIIRVPNILELVFKWSHAEINQVVLMVTILGFIGANMVLVFKKFINPINLMLLLYIINITEDVLIWHSGIFFRVDIYKLWIYSMGFFYGAFLRLTPTIVYNVIDFKPRNRLIGRYLSYMISYTIFISLSIAFSDYSHFTQHTMHDGVPIVIIIIGAIFGMISLVLYKPYYKNKVTDIID